MGGYRFFESDGDKVEADMEAMVGISGCVAKYPCKGESCTNR